MHGGSVAVDSRLGLGSRFSAKSPWQPNHDFGEVQDLEPANHPMTLQRVLVIEDTGIIAQQLGRYLHELNVTTIVIDQAEQPALAKVLEVQPDLILLDILLPGASGWTCWPN